MARSEAAEAQHPAAAAAEASPAPRIVRNAKAEEGDNEGEGWVVLRSLLLLVGGMLLASGLIFFL